MRGALSSVIAPTLTNGSDFSRLSVPCDEKSGRVQSEGFNAGWRTQQLTSPPDPFSSDRRYLSLLLSCDCLTNGDDGHRIGSRSLCPDGMEGSVPSQSAAITAEEVKPESAQCPGSMDSPRPWSHEPAHSRSLSRLPVCLFLHLYSLRIFSCLLFQACHTPKQTSEHKQSSTNTNNTH